jgi:hypothetical protein
MKIARVFIQEYPGRQIGDIHDVFSPENHPGSILSGTIKEVEVADDFDMSIMQGVVVDGEVTFEESPTKVAAKVSADKAAQITERYNDMNTDVYASMAAVFGTNNPDSATAWHQTWQLMKTNPSAYFSLGMKAHVSHGSFQVGDALDTIQKCEDYADAALAAVVAYSVTRITRIKQFQDEKAAIEGA